MRRSTRIRAAPAVAIKVEAAAAVSRATRTVRKAPTASVAKRSLSVLSSRADGVKKVKVEVETNAGKITDVKQEVLLDRDTSAAGNGPGDDLHWHDLCAVQELSCVVTLTSGQVFTWKRYAPESDVWIGVVGHHVYKLRERDQRVQYRCVHPPHRR
jgi:hypothetical protein